MKKFLFILFGVFAVAGAFAAGENVPTSKSYVDAVVAQKQDKISASTIMPAGYTQLRYIESTGTQYIDTGITGNVVVRGVAQTVVTTGTSQVLFGTSVNGASGTYVGVTGEATNWGLGTIPTTGLSTIPATTKATIEVTFDGNGATGAVNGETIERRTSAGQGALYIFATTSGNYKGAFKLWSCQVYQDNMLVRDFIPALNSNNVVGMYDMVTNTFFTNNGTGEFIAGPVIIPGNQVLTNTGTVGKIGTKGIYDATGEYAAQTQNLVDAATMNAGIQNAIDSEFQCIEYDENNECLLLQLGGITQVPAGYTALEYLESTGTQWIDTGYIPNQSSGVKTKVRFNSVDNNKAIVFGSAQAYNSKAFEFYLWDGSPEFNYNAQLKLTGNNISVYNVLELDWNKNIVNYSINNVQQQTINFTAGAFVAPYTMNIFALHRPDGAYLGLVGSIYYFKIYDNGTLVHDMVPARRDSDNVVGMYDTISGRFFTNSGTGEFIAGPVGSIVYLPTEE